MARPRKNRVGELAARLIEEVSFRMGHDVARAVLEAQREYRIEVTALRQEVRELRRQLELLGRSAGPRSKGRVRLGRWVPGGPGRPPKDAVERVAAFAEARGLSSSSRKPASRRPRRR
jgi:hypothetical protein